MRLPTVDRKNLYLVILALILAAGVFFFRRQAADFIFGRMKAAAYLRDWQKNCALRKELVRLKAKLVGLKLELSSCRRLREENQRLRQMLGLRKKHFSSLIAASVIGRTSSHWRRIVFLDKGQRAGIKEGDVILDSRANLLGKIVKAYKDRSEAVLIYDPDFKIKVRLGRVYALAAGSLWRGMSLKYIPYDAEIKLGDEVVYVHEGGGRWQVKVGRVSFVYKDTNSLTQEVFLEPYAAPAVREVFVVVK